MNKPTTAGLLIAVLAIMMITGVAATGYAQVATPGPISLQHGFPLYWEDATAAGRRVAMCFTAGCATTPPIPGNAFSQQTGFADENFFWISTGTTATTSVEFAMEAAYAAGPVNGTQSPFTRFRIRATGPNPAAPAVTVTSPFGTFVTSCDAGGVINDTLDDITALPNYVLPGGVAIVPNDFFAVTGIVPVAGQPFTGTGPINGGAFTVGVNGCGLAETITQFTADGLFFEDAANPLPNVAPVANPDITAVQFGSTAGVDIDVALNDTDADPAPRDINPVATALGVVTQADIDPATAVALPLMGAGDSMTTAAGATVSKNSDGTLNYQPSPTFEGVDTFAYTIQDNGGLVADSTVTVGVERLLAARSVLRVKHMKWDVDGSTTIFSNADLALLGVARHDMTIHLGPTGTGPALGTTPVALDGSWSFRGPAAISPANQTSVAAVSTIGTLLANLPIELR